MAKDNENNKEKYPRDEEFSKGLDKVKTSHSASAKDLAAIEALKGSKISHDTFGLLYDQLIGPGEANKKLNKDHYKAFVHAIAIGNISDETVVDPETGDRVSMIQLVLEGIHNGDPKALEIAKSRSKKSSGPLKKKSIDFRDFLKGKEERVAAKEEREEVDPEQLANEFATKAVQLTESSKTKEAVSEATRSQNWNAPEMPADLRKKRTDILMEKIAPLYDKNAKLQKELTILEDIHSAQLAKSPDLKTLAKMKSKIYDKEEDIIAVDHKIDELTRQNEALGQQFLEEEVTPKIDFLLQTEKELGYDLRFVSALRGKGDVIYTDLEIEFREEWVVIHFKENGKTKKMPWEKFKNHSYAIGLHPDYKSLEELNEEMETQGHLPLKEGQEFYGKPDSQPIKIIDVKNGTVTLDKAVNTRNSKKLKNGTKPKYAVDKIQRTMPYGEFLAFIQRENYIQDTDAQTITDQRFKGENRRARRNCHGQCTDEQFEAMGGVPNRSMTVAEGQSFSYGNDRTATMGANGELFDSLTNRPISLHTGLGTAAGTATLASGMAAANDNVDQKYAINLKTPRGRRNFQQQNLANDVASAPGPIAAPTAARATDQTAATAPSATEEVDPILGGASGQDEEEKSSGPKEKTQKNYKEEALPYSEVFKAGGMKEETRSWLKGFWANTYFMRGHDMWEMGKAMYEYYVRRWERRQKERYASVAEDVPYFSPEMKRVKQAAENEEVDSFKSSMEQMGNHEIMNTLRTTGNRDEMKAALVVLTDKGQMRWDDIEFWRNLNRHVSSSVAIPIPPTGDPAHIVSKDDKRTGADFLKDAIGSLWGEGGFDSWYSGNKSKYQSNAKGFYEEGSELEGVEGGHQRRLESLLAGHKRGEYVDPHRYEGLILHMIEFGKSSMQSKVYYLVQGVAAQNPSGHTILSFDRMAHVNSTLLVKFPLLEYLCSSVQRSDGKTHRWTIDDYRQWAKWFDDGDPMNAKPTAAVDRFLWDYVLPSDETQNRVNKAIRNGKDLDHDDMFGYLPVATEQVIQDACKSVGGGSTRVLTTEGYANGFPGFSQFFRTLSEANNRNRLKEMIKSYVRFESIMTNRWMKNNEGYARLDDSTRHAPTIVSKEPPEFFIKELNATVKAVIEAYGDKGLIDLYELAMTPVEGVRTNPQREKEQKRVQEALEKFGSKFNEVIKRDEGARMVAVIKGQNLYGMPIFVSDEEKDARKAEMLSGFESDVNLSY
ncbi:hypothetical protein JKY72_03420 [Candidatus Gracilibacteria bacterium]|nr:hypothetical protein [Candidatus Gracilibacteria bacterium]